jgi:hypothetical protein
MYVAPEAWKRCGAGSVDSSRKDAEVPVRKAQVTTLVLPSLLPSILVPDGAS